MNRIVLSAFAVAALTGVAQADIYTGGTVGSIPDGTGSNTPGAAAIFTLNASNGANPTITSFNGITMNIAHSWIGDLVITLTSPGGAVADILVRYGDTTASGSGMNMNLGQNNLSTGQIPAIYTFVNSGTPLPAVAPASGFLAAGTYNRAGAANGSVVATGASGNDFTIFNGGNVNGVWTLTIRDFFNGDVGFLAAIPPSTFEGWSLDITTTAVPTPGAAALLGMGGLLVGRRRR
ncbi:MAG: proprotein convertase P-domain-containing protein [Phycisphaerales bacterium]